MKHHDVHEPISPELIAHLRPLISLSILLFPVLTSIPPIPRLLSPVRYLFSDILTLDSFISPELPTRDEAKRIEGHGLRLWRQLILVGGGLAGLVGWTVVFGMSLVAAIQGEEGVRDVLAAAGMMIVWIYLFSQPLFRPPSTPPWSATIVYSLLWLSSLGALALAGFLRAANGHFPKWASPFWLSFEIVSVVITSLQLYVVGGLPLATPEALVRVETAPDDLVTPFTWLSFSWVDSFIRLGNEKELQSEDIPNLSPTQQCAHVFRSFNDTKARNLLWKILLANRMDIILDAVLTLVSVVLNYAGPYFLKQILDGLTDRTARAMSQAYVYAMLALAATTIKAVTDLLHLWHSRRATVRIKTELIAAIYDKSLRRKDASGVITKKDAEGESDSKDAEGKPKEEKKTNADAGKVVNLMAGDTNRIANTVAGAYYIYSAPLELIVASVFLYNILGWSAFVGMAVLAIAMPLNSMVSKRSVKITQDLLKARDGRISVMNELIGAITFIKFFAWSSQWKERATKARANEMKQMVRSLINSVYFSLLWALVPIFVTLMAFFCYVLVAKQDLTVSVAFTAISLFGMLRMPLNFIPVFVVMILQAHVSVKRIEDFLGEDEVPEWVSSLKRSSEPPLVKTKISFENASFAWNSGKQDEADPTVTVDPTTASAVPTTQAAVPNTSIDATAVVKTDDADSRFQLSDLSVVFPLGKLTVITGPTGSGKTAILTALLGEMELLSGSSHLPKFTQQVDKRALRNSVAYASQTAWLQQKSIRENILFGEKMDEERYESVLEACALLPDLEVLEDGDQTEIGAKGVSLSGGQKARVALARAVYSYTQHVLLDDPLAAVDSHTAKHLTDRCLNGPILKGRTILLVSHHVELLLPSANHIVRILDGRIDAQGTPADLRARGELDGLVAMEEAEIAKEEPVTADKAIDDEIKVVDEVASTAVSDDAGSTKGEERKGRKKAPGKKYVQDEERPVGNVKWETYKLYIVAATYITWAWALLILLISQFFSVGERYWLKIWGQAYLVRSAPSFFSFAQPSTLGYHHDLNAHQHILHIANSTMSAANETFSSWPFHDLPPARTHPLFYLIMYSGIVIGTAMLGVFSNIVGSWGQYRAAINLHDKLLDTVMSGTIRFFNVTPVGRILNRFSKDIETIDSSLNSGLRTVIIYVANLFGALAVVAVIVPWFLLPAAIISWLYLQYSILYLRVGRSLRRLEAISRSPIYSGFAELLDGVVSVRAFSAESRFLAQLCEQVDKMQAAHYYYWMMNRWLLIRFDVLGGVSVCLTTLFALTGAIDPGSAGMAILSSQSFVMGCYWVSRFWGQLEMDFNSVERVQEYLHIPQEPPAIIPSSRPPAYWPSSNPASPEGFLSVRDLEIRYAPDLPTVFSGSFEIKAGEKIGLIGRTGSGKSTLAMSFLRFCEPYKGGIWLDGLDITSMGVDDLRSRITYIPQDAVLFSGSVRLNLDPFDEHTDEELMDALARVNLGTDSSPTASRIPSRVPSAHRLAALAAEDDGPSSSNLSTTSVTATRKTPGITLQSDISAGGANFSQGQRQLIAMARALLRRSNLIIMDEATASVDFATDEAIQRAIRSEFGGSTLITIAHRLSSVIDYDRLLVLADGKVAEFDTPINLLRKDGSLFKNLCEKSGKYKDLYKAAEKKEKGELLVDV